MQKNKVILITGVTRGIGRAIAKLCAKEGFYVSGISRSRHDVSETLKALYNGHEEKWLAIGADVSSPEAVESLVCQTIERFGRIDVLINNAGVAVLSHIEDSKIADWDSTVDINLKGAYLCCRQVLPFMIKQKSGTIVNIASICGFKGFACYGAYCASKFGLLGFTEVLAEEQKENNIKVFALCPHAVDTSFAGNANKGRTRQEDMLTAEEVARAALSFITKNMPSQVREISIHPVTFLLRRAGIKMRKVFIRRIKNL